MQNSDLDNMTISELNVALKLDQQERELLESIENDEWVSVSDIEREIQRFQDIATNQVVSEKIEVQMSIQDLEKIHTLASPMGQSASSFAQNIIHKYLKGELVEKI